MKTKYLLITLFIIISCTPVATTKVVLSKPLNKISAQTLARTKVMLNVSGVEDKKVAEIEKVFKKVFKSHGVELAGHSQILPLSIGKILFVAPIISQGKTYGRAQVSKKTVEHYELALSDVKSGKILWRASTDIKGQGYGGKQAFIKTFGVEIFGQLERAHLL